MESGDGRLGVSHVVAEELVGDMDCGAVLDCHSFPSLSLVSPAHEVFVLQGSGREERRARHCEASDHFTHITSCGGGCDDTSASSATVYRLPLRVCVHRATQPVRRYPVSVLGAISVQRSCGVCVCASDGVTCDRIVRRGGRERVGCARCISCSLVVGSLFFPSSHPLSTIISSPLDYLSTPLEHHFRPADILLATPAATGRGNR